MIKQRLFPVARATARNKYTVHLVRRLSTPQITAWRITAGLITAVLTLIIPAHAHACDWMPAPVPGLQHVEGRPQIHASQSLQNCQNIEFKLTLQRHRGGPVWQNLASNTILAVEPASEITVTSACLPGTWTYRTILEDTSGSRHDVSGHYRVGC